MKTTTVFSFAIAIAILMSINVQGAVYRLNNLPGVDADYSAWSTAYSAASAGDTIYVEGSFIDYGNAYISKPLVIIGSGYFLDINDSTQAKAYPSEFDRIEVRSGAAGTVITGITARYTSSGPAMEIQTDDVQVIRCRIVNTYYNGGEALEITSTADNAIIAQSFIQSGDDYAVRMYGKNAFFLNNIILHENSWSYYTGDYAIYMLSSSSAKYVHNVVMGRVRTYNSVWQNNIFGDATLYDYANNTYQHNIAGHNDLPTGNGNVNSVNVDSVFIKTGSFSDDRYWVLKVNNPATNPAIGAGTNSINCGAFDGLMAYKKSGMPAIPAIFEATVPGSAKSSSNSTMNINIKTMSHQ